MWRRLPTTASRKGLLCYAPGGEKIWYTNALFVEPSYLVCLLEANRLFDRDVPYIQHGQPRQYYKAILDGKQPTAIQSCITCDVACEEVAALPAIGFQAGTLIIEDVADEADIEEELLALLDQPDAVERQSSQPSRGLHAVEGFDWGCFRFTPKTAVKRGAPVYSWQVACPFHRRSGVTNCKKSLSFPDIALSDAVILCLKDWANSAKLVDRQWKHKGRQPCIGVHPPADVIEANMIPEREKPIPRDVRTDAELDSFEQNDPSHTHTYTHTHTRTRTRTHTRTHAHFFFTRFVSGHRELGRRSLQCWLLGV